MTKIEAKPAVAAVNELFSKSPDGLRELVLDAMRRWRQSEGPRPPTGTIM
jgi:hypothetical protein